MNDDIINLNKPDELALKSAFRAVNKNGEINISVTLNSLPLTLKSMESIGFIGIEIISLTDSNESAIIRAFKGKTGPCFETGRFAIYKGSALSALDDDNHFLPANEKVPVCEKTANIYKLPAYDRLIECTDADPAILEKNDNIPELFNCDTFEEDQAKLFVNLKDKDRNEGVVNLFYPGPFRLLILNDGRIIRRGQSTLIPQNEAAMLIKTDKLFESRVSKPTQSVFFSDLYALKGSGWLIENEIRGEVIKVATQPDLNILKSISPELKEHLIKLITGNKKYFILTGSDMGDKLGCCPSEVVTEANRLKRAGILESAQQEGPDESCPLSVFAFRAEIAQVENDLVFSTNEDFRKIILGILEKKQRSAFSHFTKWILLAFISITLVTAFVKFCGSSISEKGQSLFERLATENRDGLVVLLFHNSERCEMCLSMEKYTSEVLDVNYPDLVKNKKIEFRHLAMDLSENNDLVERFQIYSITIVLVSFKDKQEVKSIVLNDIWEFYRDEDLFKATLKKELDNF